MERARFSRNSAAASAVAGSPSSWWVMVAIGVLLSLSLAGCLSSGDDETGQVFSPREAAEELIAGPVANEVGLGPLTASCPEMNGADAGDVFPCTAATETQREISIDATIMASGQVELTTTNVITGDALPSFEQAAVSALNATLADTLTSPLLPTAIDCGDTTVVLADDRMMICALTDPTTQQIFDVSLTINDIESRQFSLVVANQPRG